jgi:Arc/MetJ family transcription regulator
MGHGRICVLSSNSCAYSVSVIKRTSINLDLDLVAQAREILGTKNTTDTVHTALRDAVTREKLQRLTEIRFDHMPEGWLDEERRGEHWDDDEDS